MVLVLVFIGQILFLACLNMYCILNSQGIGKSLSFTKFAGDTSESTVENIARYQSEAWDFGNNENLKMKYFPNSLTKSASHDSHPFFHTPYTNGIN